MADKVSPIFAARNAVKQHFSEANARVEKLAKGKEVAA